jgi:hypothetical protein
VAFYTGWKKMTKKRRGCLKKFPPIQTQTSGVWGGICIGILSRSPKINPALLATVCVSLRQRSHPIQGRSPRARLVEVTHRLRVVPPPPPLHGARKRLVRAVAVRVAFESKF